MQPDLGRSVDLIAPALRAAIRSAVAGEAPWPLFVHGPAGTGKTRAALCLLDLVAGGEYWTAGSLCEYLICCQGGLETWDECGQTRKVYPKTAWAWLGKAPLVVLDELGCRDRVSDFHYETVKRLLDAREGKPFLALSNLGLLSLERLYDDRLASRLAAGTVVELVGADRRIAR